jgi:exodeoxyribonuclease VII large subunit
MTPSPLTVTQVNELVSQALTETFPFLVVQGEVTGLKIRQQRWISFDLKDDRSILPCFGVVGSIDPTLLEDGAVVRVSGSPRLYAPYGKYSFSVRSVEPVGEGALRKAFERLKAKLEAEGLFAAERKRPLPRIPESIGLVTSRDGAVIHDIRRTLASRWGKLRLVLAPVPVQGPTAAPAIRNALQLFNAHRPVDVLIIARGGGSYEDLAAFNDETLARAIAASRIPVVSAIGHESDVTISDLVADVRAPTPTAAAQLVVPDRQEFELRLATAAETLNRSIRQSILVRRQQLIASTHRFRRFFGDHRHTVSLLSTRLSSSLARLVERRRTRLDQLAVRVRSLDPTRILAQGYALLARPDGTVVSSVHDVTVGEQLDAQLTDGRLTTWVMSRTDAL